VLEDFVTSFEEDDPGVEIGDELELTGGERMTLRRDIQQRSIICSNKERLNGSA